MDIAVSSNFERLLFEANARNPAIVRDAMNALAHGGSFTIDNHALTSMRALFVAGRCGIDDARARIERTLRETDIVVDPHTAVGLEVARRFQGEEPMITLATAHAAKFPDAVEEAIGRQPDVPDRLANAMTREEQFDTLPNDLEAVQTYVREKRSA